VDLVDQTSLGGFQPSQRQNEFTNASEVLLPSGPKLLPNNNPQLPFLNSNVQPSKPLWSKDARREAPVPLNPRQHAPLSSTMSSGIGKAESVGQILQGNQKLSVMKFHGSTSALMDIDRPTNSINNSDGEQTGHPEAHFSRHTVTRTSIKSNPGERKMVPVDHQGKYLFLCQVLVPFFSFKIKRQENNILHPLPRYLALSTGLCSKLLNFGIQFILI